MYTQEIKNTTGYRLEVSPLEASAIKTVLCLIGGNSLLSQFCRNIGNSFPAEIPSLHDGEGNCRNYGRQLVFEKGSINTLVSRLQALGLPIKENEPTIEITK